MVSSGRAFSSLGGGVHLGPVLVAAAAGAFCSPWVARLFRFQETLSVRVAFLDGKENQKNTAQFKIRCDVAILIDHLAGTWTF